MSDITVETPAPLGPITVTPVSGGDFTVGGGTFAPVIIEPPGIQGEPGTPASLEPLPEYTSYPAQTVAERLEDLIDRKAENDGPDLVLWFQNQLL